MFRCLFHQCFLFAFAPPNNVTQTLSNFHMFILHAFALLQILPASLSSLLFCFSGHFPKVKSPYQNWHFFLIVIIFYCCSMTVFCPFLGEANAQSTNQTSKEYWWKKEEEERLSGTHTHPSLFNHNHQSTRNRARPFQSWKSVPNVANRRQHKIAHSLESSIIPSPRSPWSLFLNNCLPGWNA